MDTRAIYVALLLAVILVVLAIRMRWSYRAWMLMLVGSLCLAYGSSYWLAKHRSGTAAEQFAEQVVSELSARPWPADEHEQAGLIASFQVFDRVADVSSLNSLFAIIQMHALLNEPVPTYGSVAEALRWVRHVQEKDSKTRKAEFELLQERVVQTFLQVTVPDASANWPSELTESLPGKGFQYHGEGVWVGMERDARSSHEVLLFPIRVTNRGDAKFGDEQGPILFYFPENRRSEAERPRATFGCLHVAIGNLLPGQSKFYKCEIFSNVMKHQTLEERIQLVGRLRAGELMPWVQPSYPIEYERLTPPRADPLNLVDVRQYEDLKARDLRFGKRVALVQEALTGWLLTGIVLLAGFAMPGLLRAALPRKRVLALSIGGGILSLVVVPFAWHAGAGDGWAPLVYAIFALCADAVFVTGLVLGNILVAKGAEA